MTLAKNIGLAVVSLVAFGVLLEIALAAFGVQPVLYERDPMVGFSSRIPLYVPARREGWLFTAENKRAWFNFQRFERDKPDGVVRGFCVGGSTTYGRPYDDATSFCGWLRVLLPLADPSHRWEWINAGGISYASYRVAAVMEELVDYEPDWFIVYTGHNEFLERRTYGKLQDSPDWLLDARAALNRTRSYTALTRLLGRGSPSAAPRVVLPSEVEALLDDSVGLGAYHRDDAQREQVLTHFRLNLDRMVDIAASVGARTLFVTPASNLRTCSPFKSEPLAGLDADAQARVDDWLAKAEQRRLRRRPRKALEAVDAALAIDGRRAAAHYLRGRILDGLGRYDDARDAYRTALEEDVCPLRALPEAVAIVESVARERGVPLLDWAAYVSEQAEQGIPGDDFFLDHVHPTIDGNRRLAVELIRTLARAGAVELDPGFDDAAIARVDAEVKAGLDDAAHARALTKLAKVLGWAGKPQEAYVLLQRALAIEPEAATLHNAAMMALRVGRVEQAIGWYREFLALGPQPEAEVLARSDLGYALSSTGRAEEAVEVLQRAVALDPDHEKARFNLGVAYEKLGRYEESAAELREAIRINPDRVEYREMLADVSQRKQSTPE